jgi:hypothetical protein
MARRTTRQGHPRPRDPCSITRMEKDQYVALPYGQSGPHCAARLPQASR